MEKPDLITPRLRIRPAQLSDAAWMFGLRSDPGFMEFMDRPLMTSEDEAVAFIRNIRDRVANGTGIQGIIELRDSGEPIGYTGVWRWDQSCFLGEVGYGLDPAYTGKGYMREALSAFMEYAFNEMKIHRAEAYVRTGNLGSIRVLEECGFHREGTLRHAAYFEGTFRDLYLFSRLKTDASPV